MIQTLLLAALGFTAVQARADVSDSGNLTIGGTGVIQGTMTVQGSAFSVGGTTFSVAGGSITLGGRLNAAAAGIKWADGTTSTTASSGGGGGVFASTFTYLSSDFPIWNIAGKAIIGSTVTMTCSGSYNLRFIFNGTVRDDGSGNTDNTSRLTVLDNGAFFDGFSATKSMARSSGAIAVANVVHPLPINYRSKGLCSAGTHSFALTYHATAGGIHTMECATTGPCYFEVIEVQ